METTKEKTYCGYTKDKDFILHQKINLQWNYNNNTEKNEWVIINPINN